MHQSKSIISYINVSRNYLRRRQLKVGAGFVLLWGLGVGAVISGDFFGWNYGLVAGGFWGLTIATFLMAIMYLCMVYCLAELSTALPHAGGFYSFTRNAFGPFWGFICGVAVTIEYVLTAAAIVSGISNYLKPLIPYVPSYLVWLLAYTIFTAICIHSVELTLHIGLLLTLAALFVLGVFYVTMLVGNVFHPELLFNVATVSGDTTSWLPKGWQGVFAAIPYGIWFYLAIEILPLASEETNDVPRNIPNALISGLLTLIVLSILTLVLNSGIGGGAAAIGQSNIPLAVGFEAYFGKGSTTDLITALSLTIGLGASFHTVMYGYGRIIFSLSRAGYIPRWLSVTSENRTPYRALILGTVVGLLCVMVIDVASDTVDAVILNMAVFGALISYVFAMLSYIKLKLSYPNLSQGYQSPIGIYGAIVGSILAIFALIACYFVPTYRSGIWGIGIVMLVATVYFFLFSRHQLVAQAPEEVAALNKKI